MIGISQSETNSFTSNYIELLTTVLQKTDTQALNVVANKLMKLIEQKATLYICGNGGSAANALHIANDFTFGINPSGNSMSVEALPSNSAVLTCLANDIGYENIYSHQLIVKAKSEDALLVLSGSGNSENIINAILQANNMGVTTIGIFGFNGGKALELVDIALHFDVNDMQISEDSQVIIGHILMKILNKKLAENISDE
ncbi:phosphoheptose isomerase [Pseudoalteromonas rubra]|uniref:Phosphoheptose isomerase n=1 Tax=Pseudoalteromonas rubra TaxID=43658 RepID=A0A5S3WKB0_9GAMM|nr:SIS domain-containing protein [Pseudoalteromonas rubra]TMP27108.1 phosphoheptose isomerase [Pseudoalteromonas rubra]TMP36127.1 phosphoheptose isomerase [Pseudoalteromonas rubra]